MATATTQTPPPQTATKEVESLRAVIKLALDGLEQMPWRAFSGGGDRYIRAAPSEAPGEKRIAAMLKAKGRKVTVIDATVDPKAVADELLRTEQDRRCPDCQNWLDRYGRCLQCAESAGEL